MLNFQISSNNRPASLIMHKSSAAAFTEKSTCRIGENAPANYDRLTIDILKCEDVEPGTFTVKAQIPVRSFRPRVTRGQGQCLVSKVRPPPVQAAMRGSQERHTRRQFDMSKGDTPAAAPRGLKLSLSAEHVSAASRPYCPRHSR